MKILQLVTRRQYRGAEVFAAQLTEALAGRGHKLIFCGLYPAQTDVLDAPAARNLDLNGLRLPFNMSILIRLISLIREEKPDIIQSNGSDTLKYAVLSKKVFPHLTVIYRNISMVSSWVSPNSPIRIFNKWLFRSVDAIASVGSNAREDMIKTYDINREKVSVINRGIIPENHSAENSRKSLSDEFGFSPENPLVMHVGKFSAEKNHPFLVEAFLNVIKEEPDVRLIFVGDGPELNEVRGLVNNANATNNIFFAGHRSNVQQLLSGADLFILGSTIEGVPGVILEAGIQGVPTVAVNVGGVSEVLLDRVTGVLVPNHDTLFFAKSILQLISDRSKKEEMGGNAKNFVISNYSMENSSMNFEKLYEKCLKNN